MDYFLIIVLGIVVLSVWNSSHDSSERLRDAINRLEREIDFLRSQVAALTRDNAKRHESAAAPVEPAATSLPQPARQPEPPQAAHIVTPAMAAYRPVTKPAEPTAPP